MLLKFRGRLDVQGMAPDISLKEARKLAILGYNIGRGNIRKYIKKVQKDREEVTLENVLEKIPEKEGWLEREEAKKYAKRVTSFSGLE